MKILFVCLGNICRSPLAEGILKRKAEEAGLLWKIDSAGTNGYHTGEAPHKLSQKVARKNGIEIGKQMSTLFKKSDVAEYDMIYVMAEDVRAEMKQIHGADLPHGKVKFFLATDPEAVHTDVPDPWYGEEDGYDEVYDIIEKTCAHIVNYFSAHGQLP